MEKISHAPVESSSSSSTQHKSWGEAQDELKQKLIAEDDFPWRLATTATSDQEEVLKYVGGVDLSYSKEDPSMACGILVVLDLHTLQVVYEDFSVVTLSVPYVPGFLAFRELLMVDGNGILHPRGFGLACHLGTLANLPTIGIGKNAVRSTGGSLKPIFISIGHRISLDTAIRIVNMTCKYRVPEPIRQADIRSREYLRKHQTRMSK